MDKWKRKLALAAGHKKFFFKNCLRGWIFIALLYAEIIFS